MAAEHKGLAFAQRRYAVCEEIAREVVVQEGRAPRLTELLDRVLLSRVLGIPIFLGIMWLVFQFSFKASEPFMGWIEAGFSALGGWLSQAIPSPWWASFLSDGIVGGLGFILTFVPPIFFLFLAIAVLEDSGYLARVAFLWDRVMTRIGLSGKSVIPMLLGFGCNVPAIMATRTIENERDRLITVLVNPLISCSARLPVYVLLAGAFFRERAGTVIFGVYLLGILLAVGMSVVLRRTVFKGKPAPLVMELSPYSLPTLKGLILHTWGRGKVFLKKAGTILLLGAIVVWALSAHPWGGEVGDSYLGQLGKLLAPAFRPLGFDWRGTVALISGFMAKEIVVGTFGVLYGVEGEEAIGRALAGAMTPLSAFAFMAFVLIYVPCLATIGAIRAEAGGRWAAFAVAYELVLAYLVALLIVGVGRALGVG
jgi:ferrous iron transport protein B